MFGAILFRAQPFHNGHLHMIKTAYADCEKFGIDLYIFIGSADKYGTKRNPLPIELRRNLVINSLNGYFSEEELNHIYVFTLDDLSDEANNTYAWGNYLYTKMCSKADDTEFIFYYSDKPSIVLSWFSPELYKNIMYKFLPRYHAINATAIREAIINNEFCPNWLEYDIPKTVIAEYNTIREYLLEAI